MNFFIFFISFRCAGFIPNTERRGQSWGIALVCLVRTISVTALGIRSTPSPSLTLTSWSCNLDPILSTCLAGPDHDARPGPPLLGAERSAAETEPPHLQGLVYGGTKETHPPLTFHLYVLISSDTVGINRGTEFRYSSIRPKTPSSSSSLRDRDRRSKSSSSITLSLSSILTSEPRTSPRVKLSGCLLGKLFRNPALKPALNPALEKDAA